MSEAIHDDGPWHVHFDIIAGKLCLFSDDFTHDVRLYIDGDFSDIAQRRRYANALAVKLNRPTILADTGHYEA